MDGTRTMAEIRKTFRTPLRILVPNLLKSRDDWKAKSDTRKAQLRSAKVTIRDLTASRELWRQRAETYADDNRQLREQLQQAQRERDAALAANNEAEKKSMLRSTHLHAADSSPSRSFPCRCNSYSTPGVRSVGSRPL